MTNRIEVGESGGRGFISNGRLAFVNASKIRIGTSGETSTVRDSTNVCDLEWDGALIADITASGAGGLDTGSEAANTWYAVFIIGARNNSKAESALLSTSATAPTLPSGYDIFRRLGWVRNNGSGSGDFLDFIQKWNGKDSRILYQEARVDLRSLSSGSATTFTAVSLSAFIPSTAFNAHLHVAFRTNSGGNSTDGVDIRPTGSTVTQTMGRIQAGVVSTARIHGPYETPCDSSQNIDYKVSNSSNQATLDVAGYDDEL